MSNTAVVFKKYNGFTSAEIVGMLVTSVLAGFFLSFDDWGVEEYDVLVGTQNFLLATFAVFLLLGVVLLAQKLLGSLFGYHITYHTAWIGLVAGFFITALSYGALPFFLPGGVNYKLIKTARLGKFLPSYKHSEMFVIASFAVLIPLFFALVFGGFFMATENIVFQHITITALLFGLFALIPLPRMKSPHEWNVHGLSEFRLIKHLRGGTFGYDLASFHLTTYVILVVTALIFASLVVLYQTFSLFLSILLAVVIISAYKIIIPYLNS